MAHAIEEVLKRPIITEKSTMQVSTLNKYSFEIATWATKDHVKEAFAKLFPNSKVKKVNIGKIYGHEKRSIRGYRLKPDRKKSDCYC
jgi:large subunit ribosomal protein L23